MSGCCPDCSGKEFYEGPEGGAAQNIFCANPDCGSKYNLCGGLSCKYYGFVIGERISEPHPNLTDGKTLISWQPPKQTVWAMLKEHVRQLSRWWSF